MKNLNEFLVESNAIEDVFDDDSLKQAEHAWDYLWEQPELTTGVILKAHKILMLHQDLMPNEKGYFRTCQVWIGGREAKSWESVPVNMHTWCDKANEDEYWRDIKESHIAYENIHPFVDGNGRTGRLFMNWSRLKAGLPIQVIKASERHAYYQWFI